MGLIYVAPGHLDELQKAEKYPIRCSLQTSFTVLNFFNLTIVVVTS